MGEDKKTSERLKQYMGELNRSKYYPKDPFEHGAFLIDPKKLDDPYSDIVDTQILLTNMGSDRLLALNQQEAFLYTCLKNMAEREPELQGVYNVLYNGWRNELQISRTKDGKERDMQGAISGGQVTAEHRQGFGDELAQFREQSGEEKQNIIQKLFNRRR